MPIVDEYIFHSEASAIDLLFKKCWLDEQKVRLGGAPRCLRISTLKPLCDLRSAISYQKVFS